MKETTQTQQQTAPASQRSPAEVDGTRAVDNAGSSGEPDEVKPPGLEVGDTASATPEADGPITFRDDAEANRFVKQQLALGVARGALNQARRETRA